MTENKSTSQNTTAAFELVRGGPGCWYAMNTKTRQLLPFRTKRAAVAAVAERNAR